MSKVVIIGGGATAFAIFSNNLIVFKSIPKSFERFLSGSDLIIVFTFDVFITIKSLRIVVFQFV